jgi:hypothetical protein
MRIITAIAFLLMLFGSCSNEPKIPDDIIAPVKMKQVIWDLVRADEMVNVYVSTDTSANKPEKRTDFYQRVFQIHRINKQQFKKSFTFYQSHPDLLKIVLDSAYNQAVKPVTLPKNPVKSH